MLRYLFGKITLGVESRFGGGHLEFVGWWRTGRGCLFRRRVDNSHWYVSELGELTKRLEFVSFLDLMELKLATCQSVSFN